MKKIIYISIILFVFSGSSCEDFLDEQPVSQLSSGNYWKTENDIITAMAGMYDGMQDIVDANFINWGEGRSDNFTRGGTGETEYSFAYNAMTADMGTTDWTSLYAIILRANLIIKYVPEIEGDLTDTEKNNYLAQAYAIRAYCHLLGVKVWGDFPLVQEVIEDKDAQPARTPVDEVLNAVVADLITARELVDEDNTDLFEVNLGGILAILTEAYMWQHEYQKAIETTDELLATGRYELEQDSASWKRIFTDPGSLESPSEPIWSLYRDIEVDPGNGIANYIGSGDRTSSFVMDPNVLARWEQQGDQEFRESLTYDTLDAEQEGAVGFIWKYFPLDENTGDPGESLLPRDQAEIRNPMYRLADIVLLRAEAYNQLGNEQEAVDLLNDIKTRAGMDPVSVDDFNTIEELEMAILDERQFELFAEGKRWFDLRRTGLVVTIMGPLLEQRQAEAGLTVVGFGDEGLILFPVNRDVLNANPSLVQNPPYTR
ncbi:MAG: RagB/SusD family nutrient uptake outer membrane protein [Cyclobacteriaceae bacterium]